MAWPVSQDYNEAVQDPQVCFTDPDLKNGEVELNPLGLPIARTGNFADVYQIKSPDGKSWAVKCFTRQVAGLQERYAKVDQCLRKADLPFTVGFRYLPEGVRIRGQWYPILKMEWVAGFALNDFVRNNLDKRANLEALFQIWLRLSKRLREARIAHADLQHGNVLLVPGAKATTLGLKLIDYDGMWVPELANQPSGELGHPAYQHPRRSKEQVYSQELDRFPHLVIGTALLATMVSGRVLWERFDNGDNVLFREQDLRGPDKSPLIRAMWDLGNPVLMPLLGQLILSCAQPVEKTPWLDELMASPDALALNARQQEFLKTRLGLELPSATTAITAQVEEAPNVFADLTELAEERPFIPRPKKKSSGSMLPWLIGGGVALFVGLIVLTGAVVIAYALTRPPGTTPEPTRMVAATRQQTTPTTKSRPPDDPPKPPEMPPMNPPAPPPMTPVAPMPVERKATGGMTEVWRIPTGAVTGCAEITPNGRTLVIATTAKPPYLVGYDLAVGRQVFRHRIEGGFVRSLCIFPDGNILTVDDQRLAVLWNRASGAKLFEIPFEKSQVQQSFAAAANQPLALCPGAAKWRVCMYRTDNGEYAKAMELPSEAYVSHVQYAPDGKRWLAVDSRSRITLVDAQSGRTSVLNDATRTAFRAAFSPDNKLVVGFCGNMGVSANAPKVASIWDTAARSLICKLEGHEQQVEDATFLPNSIRVATISRDKSFRLWDARTGKELANTPLPTAGSCVRALPDGKHVLTITFLGRDAAIQLWRGEDDSAALGPIAAAPSDPPQKPIIRTVMPEVPLPDLVEGPVGRVTSYSGATFWSVKPLNDGKRFLTAGFGDKEMRLWDIASGKVQNVYSGHTGPVPCIACTPDGKTAVSGSHDGSLIVWSVDDGKKLRTLVAPNVPRNYQVYGCAIASDGKTLYSVGPQLGLRQWDVTAGEQLKHYAEVTGGTRLVMSPDETQLLIPTIRNGVLIFDVGAGRVVGRLALPNQNSSSVAVFSPDGRRIFTGSEDHEVRIWNAKTQLLEKTLSGHTRWVNAVVVSDDGKRLITGADDNTLRVWNIATGIETYQTNLGAQVQSLCLTPDQRRIFVGLGNRSMVLWRLPK